MGQGNETERVVGTHVDEFGRYAFVRGVTKKKKIM